MPLVGDLARGLVGQDPVVALGTREEHPALLLGHDLDRTAVARHRPLLESLHSLR